MEIFGVNSRLDVINAQIIDFRLSKLKNVIKKRKKNIETYKKHIKAKELKFIEDTKYKINSNTMFIVLCEKRDELKKYLEKFKIQTLVYYGTPLHKHIASKKLIKNKKITKAEFFAKKVLALPHHQNLKQKDIRYVCDKINKFYEK